jgi:hypothetical protein
VFRRSSSGIDALRELEWAPTLDLTDAYSAESFIAVFRAQGRSLAATPALGLLMAQRLGVGEGPGDLETIASYRAGSQRGEVAATVSGASLVAERIVVDTGADAVLVGRPSDFSLSGPQPLDDAYVNVTADVASLERVFVEDLGSRRIEAERLARLASALEMLGVSEQLMQMAVSYTQERKQFGSAIGSFPAVQQILAAAEVELVGLRNCCDIVMGEAVRSVAPSPLHDAMLVKALAGRTTRRIAQAALQSLGAVGFTWENDHHRYQRRALTLDALFGSYHELVAQLGEIGTQSGLRRVGVL